MPVGAFYGQDGGELARRVSDQARSDPAREVHFLGQDRCVLWSRSDHARKVRFMVKKGGSTVSWTKTFKLEFLLSPEVYLFQNQSRT